MNIRISFLSLFFLLLITSGARTVSAEMIGIPRTEVDLICPIVGTETQTKDITSHEVVSVPETSVQISPTVPPTAEKPSSLSSDILLNKINAHREAIGLPAFQKDDKLCALAKERGPELYDEIFVNGNIHSGLYNRNLPYWITENMKYGPDEDDVFNWWMNSPIHRKAIEGNFTFSCGECYGHSCAQLFTSYVAK